MGSEHGHFAVAWLEHKAIDIQMEDKSAFTNMAHRDETIAHPSELSGDRLMAPIRAQSQIAYLPLVMTALFPIAFVGLDVLATGEWRKGPLIIGAIFSLVPILGGWSQAIQRRRWCEIDPTRQKVTVHTVTMWFAPKVQSYSLDRFGAVRSYLTGHKRVDCCVELVTQPGGEGLLLATFPPSSTSTSFWSTPKDSEPTAAQTLRQRVAEQCALKDQGFAGHQWPGAQLGN